MQQPIMTHFIVISSDECSSDSRNQMQNEEQNELAGLEETGQDQFEDNDNVQMDFNAFNNYIHDNS